MQLILGLLSLRVLKQGLVEALRLFHHAEEAIRELSEAKLRKEHLYQGPLYL